MVTTLAEGHNLSRERIFATAEAKKYMLLYCIMIFGIPFAEHRGVAFKTAFLWYSVNVLFFYLLIIHIDSRDKLNQILFTISLAVFCYCLFTLVVGLSGLGRLSVGSIYDPNDLAYFFVTLFPLSIPFIKGNHPTYRRAVATLVIILSPLVIFLTASRGGFLAFLAAFLLFSFTGFGGFKRSHKGIIVVGLILLLVLFGNRIDFERYQSLKDLKDDYNITSETGRIEIWKTGLKIIKSHPITGVGFKGFGRAHGYKRDAEGRIPIWKAAHNSYIQLCTELGIPAFLVFMSLIIGSFRSFLLCRNHGPSIPEHKESQFLCGIFIIAFTSQLIAAFFLDQAYSQFFPLFFALSTVMNKTYTTTYLSN